jgi:hypothetical protein
VDAAAQSLDLAVRAEQAGDHDLAESLRKAAAEATAKANAVDTAVTAFESATAEADYAVEGLIGVTRTAGATLRRLRGDDQPAERVESGAR